MTNADNVIIKIATYICFILMKISTQVWMCQQLSTLPNWNNILSEGIILIPEYGNNLQEAILYTVLTCTPFWIQWLGDNRYRNKLHAALLQ